MPFTPDQLAELLDGDTLRTGDGVTHRLQGFDAPEMGHEDYNGLAQEPGANLSAALTAAYMARQGATLQDRGTDPYGRTLSLAGNVDGSTLAEEQLRRGLAFPATGMTNGERRAFWEGLQARRNPQTGEQRLINASLDEQWSNARANWQNVRKQTKRGFLEKFTDSIERGLDQVGEMTGGLEMLAGEMTGIDALSEDGRQRARRNALDVAYNRPDIGTLENVHDAGDAVTWALEKLGEQGPNLGAMIGAGLATGGTGWALEGGAILAGEKLAANAAIRAMAMAGKALTREVGVVAAGATLNIGESKLGLDEKDPNGEHNLLALGTGLVKTGLDVFALGQIPGVGKYLMPRAKALGLTPKEAISAWKDIPTAVLRASLTEGSTEGMQDLLDQSAQIYKAGGEVDWQQVLESGATGALVGGVAGAGGGVTELQLSNFLKPRESAAPAATENTVPPPPAADPTFDAATARERIVAIDAMPEEVVTPEIEAERADLFGKLRAAPRAVVAEAPADNAAAVIARVRSQIASTEAELEREKAKPSGTLSAVDAIHDRLTALYSELDRADPVVLASESITPRPKTIGEELAGDVLDELHTDPPTQPGDPTLPSTPSGRDLEPGGVRETPPAAPADTRPRTSIPLSRENRAATPIGPATEVTDPLTREAQRGTRQENAPADGAGATSRLSDRIRALPWVQSHLLIRSDKPNSSMVKIEQNGHPQKVTVRHYNDLVVSLARQALEQRLSEAHGIDPNDKAAHGPRFAGLMHGVASNATDRLLEETLQELQHDKRYKLSMVGRPEGADNDRGVGLARPGQLADSDEESATSTRAEDDDLGMRMDDDNGRGADTQEYPGQEEPIQTGTHNQIRVDARSDTGELAQQLGKHGIEATAEELTALNRHPALSTYSVRQIAKWVADQGDAAAAVRRADQVYKGQVGDGAIYSGSDVARRDYDEMVAGNPRLAAVEREEQRDIEDHGRTRDIANAGINEDTRAGRRAAAAIRNQKNVTEVEAETATEDELTSDTLSERLFGGAEAMDSAIPLIHDGATASNVVDALLQRAPKRSVVRLLLQAMKPFVRGVKVGWFEPDAEGYVTVDGYISEDGQPTRIQAKGARGLYNPANRTILLRKGTPPGVLVHVFLHEAMHSVTHGALRNNTAFNDRITRIRERAAKEFERRRAEFLDEDGEPNSDFGEIAYGLKDNDEFTAQLFSSPAFLDFLESVAVSRLSKANLLQDIVRKIADLLGLRENTSLGAAAMEDVLLEMMKGPKQAEGEALASAAIQRLRNSPTVREFTDARGVERARVAGSLMARGAARVKRWSLDAGEALLTSDWQLRRNLERAFGKQRADALADMFWRRSGLEGEGGMLQRAHTAHGLRTAHWQRIIKAHTPEGVARAWRGLQDRNAAAARYDALVEEARRQNMPEPPRPAIVALTPAEQALDRFFAEIATYVESAGVKGFHRVEGQHYLPQIYDKAEAKARQEELVALITGMEYFNSYTGEIQAHTDQTAREFVAALLKEHEKGVNGDIPWAGSLRQRTLIDPSAQERLREAGFMYSEIGMAVEYYLASVTKQTEFERAFGDYARIPQVDAEGNVYDQLVFARDHKLIRATLRGLYGLEFGKADIGKPSFQRAIDRAVREGAFEEEPNGYKVWQRDFKFRTLFTTQSAQVNQRVKIIVAGYMGNLGADMNPTWRRTQQWLMTVEAVTTLVFSTVSSIPELGLHAAMAPNWASLRDGVAAFAKNPKATFELLRMFGYAGEHAAHIALADSTQQLNMQGLPRKILDTFFKLNLQHQWTAMMRGVALQTYLSGLKTAAARGDGEASDFVKQFGLTLSEVQEWIADGMPAFTVPQQSGDAFDTHPVARAMHRFVDERVVMPSAPNLPVFFNDPKFALFTQLKRFFYAYGSQIIGGMARHAAQAFDQAQRRGDTKGMAAAKALAPYLALGAFCMPLAMLAGELKDLLRYEVWGESPPKWRDKKGIAKYWDAARKSGMLGPADLAVALFDDTTGGVETLLGPALAHLDVGLEEGFASKEFLRRSTPVASQFPGFWRWLEKD